MKGTMRKVVNIILIFFAVILLVLVIMSIYHHIRLGIDETTIEPIGTIVNVDGYNMNIYIEGEKKSENDPTIVLLSGSGVTSPIYDYKVLYSKISVNYKVAVVEKFGYGYSDVSGISRDVETMVEENRKALAESGESAPYVLMPHSMSALEAIYWAHKYPSEVQAIVGLDMAVPDSYTNDNMESITFMKIGVFFGFHRFKIFNLISDLGITEKEYEQNKFLNYRNSLNMDVYNECKVVLKNADTVRNMDISNIPMLMFTTNLGSNSSDEVWSGNWVAAQDNFAAKLNECIQIKYDCSHNVHYYKSEEMSATILEFLKNLSL